MMFLNISHKLQNRALKCKWVEEVSELTSTKLIFKRTRMSVKSYSIRNYTIRGIYTALIPPSEDIAFIGDWAITNSTQIVLLHDC